MKKCTQALFIAVIAVVASISMTACKATTGSQVSSSNAAISSTVSSEAAVSSEKTVSSKKAASSEAISKADNKKIASLAEYLKLPEVQETLSPLISSLSKQGMKLDVSADGNKLVYTYTYQNNVKVDADKLNTALVGQTATFQGIAATLKQTVDVENPVVVVRYLDNSGKEITSHEFPAK